MDFTRNIIKPIQSSAWRFVPALLYIGFCVFALAVTFPSLARDFKHGIVLSWPRKDVYIAPELGWAEHPIAGISSDGPARAGR